MTAERERRAGEGKLVALDAVAAVLAIALSWAILGTEATRWPAGSRDPDGAAYALVVLANAPLLMRRRAPVGALVTALAAALVYLARQYPPVLAAAVPLIIYTAATRLGLARIGDHPPVVGLARV